MKRFLLTLVLLAGLLLSACAAPTTYPAPQPLSLYADYKASASSTVAIAMSPTGTSHIVRTQCDTTTGTICRLIYQSIRGGSQINGVAWGPASDHTYRDPDITLVGELAFIVFQDCMISTGFCMTRYGRPVVSDEIPILEALFTREVPLVVSRGGLVYAVHEVPLSATGTALRFCYIPLSASSSPVCNWVSPHPEDDPKQRTDATADVDGEGYLHVGYLLKETSKMTAFYADNTGNWLEDMTSVANHHISKQTATSPDTFVKPALAVQFDNAFVYLAVAKKISSASDMITVHFSLPGDPDTGASYEMEMAPEKEWEIYGNPSITTWLNPLTTFPSAEIAFASFTTDHPNETDIYTVRYVPYQPRTAPLRLYITSLGAGTNDSDPIISVTGGWPVIGWHIYNGVVEDYDDVYVYSFSGQIIHKADWNGGRSLDMAGNGDYVAGVWNETQADGRLATWFAYNAHMLWLPVVKK